MVSNPDSKPVPVGAKVTLRVQLPPGARMAGQSSVSAQLPWADILPTKVTVSGLVKVGSLRRLMVNGELVEPFFRAPKSRPALGDIRSGLGSFAFNSTGNRPLSISHPVVTAP